MSEMTEAYAWHDRLVIDIDGRQIGKIEETYNDEATGIPEWALVKTGGLGSRGQLVPLAGAVPSGEEVQVPVSKDQVNSAPEVAADEDLSEDEELRLLEHYGIAASPRWAASTPQLDRAAELDATAPPPEVQTTQPNSTHGELRVPPPSDVAETGSAPDEAVVRSEEELRIGVQRRERGRVRLRKYVVTEQVTTTIPVRREVVRVEHEPIVDEGRPGELQGPAQPEEEREVILHEEQPVVEKRVVPKERVRLRTDVVEDQREVTEELRKERIDTDAPEPEA